MPVSDELSKLAVRAKEAEDRVTAAPEKARAGSGGGPRLHLSSSEKQNKVLRELVREEKGRISDHWNELQAAWNEIVTKVRDDIDDRKAEHDLQKTERRANNAEEDARFAIDFAYSAIVEAEYSSLDAALARMTANELSDAA